MSFSNGEKNTIMGEKLEESDENNSHQHLGDEIFQELSSDCDVLGEKEKIEEKNINNTLTYLKKRQYLFGFFSLVSSLPVKGNSSDKKTRGGTIFDKMINKNNRAIITKKMNKTIDIINKTSGILKTNKKLINEIIAKKVPDKKHQKILRVIYREITGEKL